MLSVIISFSVLVWFGLSAVGEARGVSNFLYVREGGVNQYRIYFNYDGLLAELVSNSSSGVGRWSMRGTGSVLLTADLAIDTGRILDCTVTSDPGSARGFSAHFREQTSSVPSGQSLDLGEPARNGSVWFQQLHTVPADYKNLLNLRWMEDQCQHLHALSNPANYTGTNQGVISRVKRQSSNLIFPGTKWCGGGSEASSRPQVGRLAVIDRCCRHHDFCPLHINGLARRYRLFNYSLFTLSHCNCDLRFHTCLKMADSGAADMIGNIFFNVVRTRCFILKRKRVCEAWDWVRQECSKYKLIKQAFLKEPISY